MKLLPIILMFLLISCSQEVWVEYSFNIENGNNISEKEKSRINQILQNKLHKFGFREAKVRNSKNILIVDALMNPNSDKEDLNFKAIFESNKLELMDTYKIPDQALNGIDTLKLEENNFTPYYKLPSGYYTDEVLGISNSQSNLEDIRASISTKINHFKNIELYWSEGEINEKSGELTNFKLYMIKKATTGNATLTEMDLQSINSEEDSSNPNSYNIIFKFNEAASKQWTKMTEQATYRGNRSIAIIVNDKVKSVPRVMSPIYGGYCSISGSYTKEEAQKLAKSISIGRLDYKLKLIRKTTIQEK